MEKKKIKKWSDKSQWLVSANFSPECSPPPARPRRGPSGSSWTSSLLRRRPKQSYQSWSSPPIHPPHPATSPPPQRTLPPSCFNGEIWLQTLSSLVSPRHSCAAAVWRVAYCQESHITVGGGKKKPIENKDEKKNNKTKSLVHSLSSHRRLIASERKHYPPPPNISSPPHANYYLFHFDFFILCSSEAVLVTICSILLYKSDIYLIAKYRCSFQQCEVVTVVKISECNLSSGNFYGNYSSNSVLMFVSCHDVLPHIVVPFVEG